MKRPLKMAFITFAFSAVVIVSLCYLTYNTYGNWSFALALRGKSYWLLFLLESLRLFQLLVFKRSRKIIS